MEKRELFSIILLATNYITSGYYTGLSHVFVTDIVPAFLIIWEVDSTISLDNSYMVLIYS